MKLLALLLIPFALAGCGTTHNKELPRVKRSDPILRLNPDRWGEQVNDLISEPAAR